MELSLTHILISLLTLTFLEVVLGVDNLVFIAITTARLPKHQQKPAQQWGLSLAWVTRLLLLAFAVWLIGLNKPWFTLFAHPFSIRDLFLILGGLFLFVKATLEIHQELNTHKTSHRHPPSRMGWVLLQIAILDIIFSIDSILTAVGLIPIFWIMATAITITIIIMICAANPLCLFIQKNPSVKMLALSYLLLIGLMLITDGFHTPMPRGYLYFAICFSLLVEALNLWMSKKKKS